MREHLLLFESAPLKFNPLKLIFFLETSEGTDWNPEFECIFKIIELEIAKFPPPLFICMCSNVSTVSDFTGIVNSLSHIMYVLLSDQKYPIFNELRGEQTIPRKERQCDGLSIINLIQQPNNDDAFSSAPVGSVTGGGDRGVGRIVNVFEANE